MVFSAVRMPSELLEIVLSFVADTHRLWYFDSDFEARQEEMRYLSACSLTCLHWAQVIRIPMYNLLVLRSAEDLYTLRTILRATSCPRIPHIGNHLASLLVVYKLVDFPWFHSVQWLQADGAHGLRSLKLRISGPVPAAFTSKSRRAVCHPLFYCAPRTVPLPYFKNLSIIISLRNIHFATYTTLLNLISDLYPLRFTNISCESVTWDQGPLIPLPHPIIMTIGTRESFTLLESTATSCTDDILVNSAIHCHTRRRSSRGRQQLLNASDCIPLFCIMRLFYENKTWSRYDLGPLSARLWGVDCRDVAEEYFPMELIKPYSAAIMSIISGVPIGFSCLTRRSGLSDFNDEKVQCFVIFLNCVHYNPSEASYYVWAKDLKAVLNAFDWDTLLSFILQFSNLDCIAVRCDLYQGLIELAICWKESLGSILDIIWPRDLVLYYEDDETSGIWHKIGYEALLERIDELGPEHKAPR